MHAKRLLGERHWRRSFADSPLSGGASNGGRKRLEGVDPGPKASLKRHWHALTGPCRRRHAEQMQTGLPNIEQRIAIQHVGHGPNIKPRQASGSVWDGKRARAKGSVGRGIALLVEEPTRPRLAAGGEGVSGGRSNLAPSAASDGSCIWMHGGWEPC